MSKIEKIRESVFLFDKYQNLLTKKQQEIFKLYFYEDYSLNEIALKFEISRNAIYSTLENAQTNLKKFEEKLNLQKKYSLIEEAIIILESEINISNLSTTKIKEQIQIIKDYLN